jgi:CRISPR-associated protein Csb2
MSRRGGLSKEQVDDLSWLETLDPPIIAYPEARRGESIGLFVPNNDLDQKGCDPKQIPNIRSGKLVQPWMLAGAHHFLFVWSFDAQGECLARAQRIVTYAEHLHQFGRGVDMAFAVGHVLDAVAAESLLRQYVGKIARPQAGRHANVLDCPRPGSLARLVERHAAMGQRFQKEGTGSAAVTAFVQPPQRFFRPVSYDGQHLLQVYVLRNPAEPERMATWPMTRTSELVTTLRDLCLARLKEALPNQAELLDSMLIGRKPGAETGREVNRVQIIPLPSTGIEYVSRQIRRVLVVIPRDEAVAAEDIAWAFGQTRVVSPGLVASGDDSAKESQDGVIQLEEESESKMLEHYGVGAGAAAMRWRTVTASALPGALRRRIDPESQSKQAKGGRERIDEEVRAMKAVRDALRHAGLPYHVQDVAVQREPFARKGVRAEEFAVDTRFEKERMWHVELEFRQPQQGPVLLGDGRFLGLGLMEPCEPTAGILTFSVVEGLVDSQSSPEGIGEALRRAVIARVQEQRGRGALPASITGHWPDGSPVRDQARLHYLFDAPRQRLVLMMRGDIERGRESEDMRLVRHAMEGFCELRAGAAGLLTLHMQSTGPDIDPLLRAARSWESATPYRVNRYRNLGDAKAAIVVDVIESCHVENIPRPIEVDVVDIFSDARRGLRANLRLHFATAIAGPLLLGRSRYKGGGLFQSVVD